MNSHEKIKRISNTKEFASYLEQALPVIVTGVVENWPGYSLFSMDYFASSYSDIELPCKLDHGIERMTLTELSRHLKEGDSKTCYAPQLPFFNYLNIGKQGDLGSQACPVPKLLNNFNEANIWIGRGVTPLHFDGYDNFLTVMEGEKKLMLFPPEAMPLAKTKKQWCQIRAHRLADIYPDFIEVVVKPGEMLYIPPYWLHEVSVPTQNAISINYWYHQQYGESKSYFLPHIEGAVQNLESMLLQLNNEEVKYISSILEDMYLQFNEGLFPIPQSLLTWSHHGRDNEQSNSRRYIRPDFIFRGADSSQLLSTAKQALYNVEQMAAELNLGERGHFTRVVSQILSHLKAGTLQSNKQSTDYFRASFL